MKKITCVILTMLFIVRMLSGQSGLNVNQGTPISLTGILTVGTENGAHIAIDVDDIQRKNGPDPGTISINRLGGDVRIGSGDSRISIDRGTSTVGIGILSAETRFQVVGTNDASLSSNGIFMVGTSSSSNIVMDQNEIMARNNGSASTLFVNRDGGNVELFGNSTGNLIVHDIPFGDRGNMQYESATGKFFYDNSSRRYKEHILTLEDDWSKILKTRPVTYTRPENPDRWEYGYVAEEIDSIGLTTMVGYDLDGNPEDVRYDKMIIYLVEMLKIQQEQIKTLQEQINRKKPKRRIFKNKGKVKS